jgi:hypothetical protein
MAVGVPRLAPCRHAQVEPGCLLAASVDKGMLQVAAGVVATGELHAAAVQSACAACAKAAMRQRHAKARVAGCTT